MSYITSETEIRSVIGTPPKSIYLKKINLLEQHSIAYLQMSHLIAIAANALPNKIQLIATQKSNLVLINETTFSLKIGTLSKTGSKTGSNSDSNTDSEIHNVPCGIYVLVAGFEESLRINGNISITHEKEGQTLIEIKIDELYFHCAKSIKRSRFWSEENARYSVSSFPESSKFSDTNVRDFIQHSPFLLLATQNANGEADLSPRGDPHGFVRIIDENCVLIPERPGNRIADSLQNLVANESMAIILFVPGSTVALTLIGSGKITTSETILKDSEIKNKTPKIGIELTISKIHFAINPALANQNLWDRSEFVDRSTFPSLGVIVSEQLAFAGKLPGSGSIIGRALGKIVGAASDLAIKQDYKKNLY